MNSIIEYIFLVIILTGFIYFFISKKDKKSPNIIYNPVDIIKDSEIYLTILKEMNKYRAKINVKPLVLDDFTSNIAEIRIDVMLSDKRLSHDGFTIQASKLLKLGAEQAGENIAYGYASPEAVSKAWYNSPGHKKELLNPNYDWCGIAARERYFVVFFGGDDKIN